MKQTIITPYVASLCAGIMLVSTALGFSLKASQMPEDLASEDEPPATEVATEEKTHADTVNETHSRISQKQAELQAAIKHSVAAYSATDAQEILWLARIIFSETKRYDEQVLIAWIARNRVDTGYRGTTYKEVALAPGQFSGLHSSDSQYHLNISRNYGSRGQAWENALSIAKAVYYSDPSLRPFPQTTRHFFSPMSVALEPEWSQGRDAMHKIVDPHTSAIRFAFYDGVR